MNRRSSRQAFVWVLIVCLMLSSVSLVSAASADVKGHWAEPTINSWTSQGFVSGYEDGTFRPEVKVNRQEFTAFVNRSFSFVAHAAIDFSDVTATDWSYSDISKAKAAGYISGYPDGTFGPKKEISRQEAAVIVANLLELKVSSSADKFTDAKNSAAWSKSAIGAVNDQGIMVGYPDGTFRPEQSVTRAETVVLLDRALKVKATMIKTTTYDKAGTYGPLSGVETIEGNVVISAQDVTLQNVTITGDLLLAASIGEGDVFLKNVTVEGKTVVEGGGVNSIHFENSTIGPVVVNKPIGSVRIVASGTTTVGEVTLQSSALLEESNLTGAGFEDVVVSAAIPDGSNVQLDGKFVNVDVNANNITMDIPTGIVTNLDMNATSTGSSVHVEAAAHIDALLLDAAVAITGKGTIDRAELNVSGATIEQTPKTIEVADGVIATVGGVTAVTTRPTPTPTPPSTWTPTPAPQSSAKAMTSFSFVGLTPNVVGTINEDAKTIALTVPFGTNVTTLVPTIVTTGTSVAPNTGVAQSFTTPVTYTVTAENGSTSAYVVTVTAASTVVAGANVTIDAPANNNITAWLAPTGTELIATEFVATGATKSSSTDATIEAPTTLGNYNLFLVDATDALNPTVTLSPVGTLTVAAGWGVDLGIAGNFAVLSKAGISTTGSTLITGNIGVSPTAASSLTGFGLTLSSEGTFSTSATVVGSVYAADYTSPTPSNLTTAISNMETAYTDAAGRASNFTELHSGNVSGKTLVPGVYKWGTNVLINSDVTLSGDADDVWIFQISQSLIQASGAKIILIGGAKAENIFWQVAGSVTIGTTAHFEGIILGMTNIAVLTNATVNGRLLAQTAVTLDQNAVVEPTSTTDLGKLAIANANLSLGDIDLNAVSANIDLPAQQNDATVTWVSSDTNIISDNGTRVGNGTATLTATITVGDLAPQIKVFTVTVTGI